jgi:hypothetical protein
MHRSARTAPRKSDRQEKGTVDCVRQELAAGIPTYLIADKQGIPRRLQAEDKRLQCMAGPSLRTYPSPPTAEVEVIALPDFYNSTERIWDYASFAGHSSRIT